MEDYNLDRSIIMAGGTLLLATFIILILYFVISTPLSSMFDSIDDVDAGEATDEMNTVLPIIRTALDLAFAIAIITPSVIFVLWVFMREPDWRYRKRF